MNKGLLALCMSVIMTGACTSKKQAEPMAAVEDNGTIYMFVGSYASPQEEGIKAYRFSENTGKATFLSGLKGISNPSYITPSVDGERIYAVGENSKDASTANAIAFDKEEGKLTLLNSQPAGDEAPCYITLSPSGYFAVTANYGGGNITVFPLDKDGKLTADTRSVSFIGNGPDKERQAKPHLHSVEFTPDHKYLLANDLGSDKIHVLQLSDAVTDGAAHSLLTEEKTSAMKIKPGSGPRHICFHPNQKFAYLINELSGEVTVLSYNNGKLHDLQYIKVDTLNAQGSGDIHISPDGKFVYASNRLQGDGIAILAVDEAKGTLTRVGYQPTGIHPRNFALTPNGRYLLVACRDSNCIQIFEVDRTTGLLTDTRQNIETHQPVCIKFTY